MNSTHRFLSHNELFNLLHLGDVVFVGLELSLTDSLIDADQSLPRDILPIIHTWHTGESRVTIQYTVKVKGFIKIYCVRKFELDKME